MKKILFMPSIMGNIFKSMNLDIQHIPWSEFNEKTIGNDKFKLPKQDQELFYNINVMLSDYLGLPTAVGYNRNNEAEDNELLNKIALMPNTKYSPLFEISYNIDDNFILFTFDHTRIVDFRKPRLELVRDIIDELGRFIPSKDLIDTYMVKNNFIY